MGNTPPPDDEDYSEKLPPTHKQNVSIVDKLVEWIKHYPEKIVEILHTLSQQVLDTLPPELQKQIKAIKTGPKKQDTLAKDGKEKKQQKDKARADEVLTVTNLKEKQGLAVERNQTQQGDKTQAVLPDKNAASDKSQAQPQEKPATEKEQKSVDKQAEKPVEKSQPPEKPRDTRPPRDQDKKPGGKPPKPQGARSPKGGRKHDKSAEMAALLLEEERRQQEAQNRTSPSAPLTAPQSPTGAVIGNQQGKEATTVAKHIVDYATQHGVDINPSAIANDKTVAPMAASDSNSLNAANAKKSKDGLGV